MKEEDYFQEKPPPLKKMRIQTAFGKRGGNKQLVVKPTDVMGELPLLKVADSRSRLAFNLSPASCPATHSRVLETLHSKPLGSPTPPESQKGTLC